MLPTARSQLPPASFSAGTRGFVPTEPGPASPATTARSFCYQRVRPSGGSAFGPLFPGSPRIRALHTYFYNPQLTGTARTPQTHTGTAGKERGRGGSDGRPRSAPVPGTGAGGTHSRAVSARPELAQKGNAAISAGNSAHRSGPRPAASRGGSEQERPGIFGLTQRAAPAPSSPHPLLSQRHPTSSTAPTQLSSGAEPSERGRAALGSHRRTPGRRRSPSPPPAAPSLPGGSGPEAAPGEPRTAPPPAAISRHPRGGRAAARRPTTTTTTTTTTRPSTRGPPEARGSPSGSTHLFRRTSGGRTPQPLAPTGRGTARPGVSESGARSARQRQGGGPARRRGPPAEHAPR